MMLAANAGLRFLDVWQHVRRQDRVEFRNIAWLVKIVLLIPIDTSECERGFSLMGRIKSDWRAALNTETMCALIRIALHGPAVNDFNPNHPIDLWYRAGQRRRRPDCAPYGPRERAHENNHESDSE